MKLFTHIHMSIYKIVCSFLFRRIRAAGMKWRRSVVERGFLRYIDYVTVTYLESFHIIEFFLIAYCVSAAPFSSVSRRTVFLFILLYIHC